MKIDYKIVNNTLYVGLSGELDEHAAHFVRGKLDELFSGMKMLRVVLDMSEVGFMDSTGVGVVIGRFKKLSARNIPVYIANPSKPVDKVFGMTGIYDIIPKIV